MMSVTIDQVLAWEPCYAHEEIVALFAGREQMTALEILDLDIPTRDRIWAVLHPELIDVIDLHGLACDFAERSMLSERKACREPDPRLWAAIDAKRRWLAGEATDAELAAAREAAREAARVAARVAARAAEEAAARAAWAAAWEAAAGEAERTWQLARIREVLEKEAR
jgi:hypothetical protein